MQSVSSPLLNNPSHSKVFRPTPLSPSMAPSHPIAIVIAGQNYDHYLEECFNSCLSQSLPCEIVYSDDCSTDQAMGVACKYIEKGIRVVPSGVHRGVCDARNRGALATSAPWIIFVDSDDRLPSNYAQQMLEDIQRHPDASFIYPSTKCFGTQHNKWTNIPWDEPIRVQTPEGERIHHYDMWVQNQVSTTTCWSRRAFLAAGMWKDMPTMWDYSLAIRCSRFGTPYPGRAILDYRIHDESQSAQLNERMSVVSRPYKEMIRRQEANLGIGCLVSGRLPQLFPRWITNLSRTVRYALSSGLLPRPPKLQFLLHNKAQEHIQAYTRFAAKFADTFSSISFEFLTVPVPDPTIPIPINLLPSPPKVASPSELGSISQDEQLLGEVRRRISVSTLLSKACNRLQSLLDSDLVWLIEDDILVPMESCSDLYKGVTGGDTPPIGVSGLYWNRHIPSQVLGGYIKNGKHFEPTFAFNPMTEVDFVGTGCLMYWTKRPASPREWKPLCKIEKTTAHDWAWSEEVQEKGGVLIVDGKVDCKHYTTESEFV